LDFEYLLEEFMSSSGSTNSLDSSFGF